MMDVPIFVINLERDIERRNHMAQSLAALDLVPEFVAAVDGRQLSAPERALYDQARALRIYGVSMMDTEIACYLSHHRLYERIVREGIEMALIMEDDVRIEPILPDILRDLSTLRTPDWLVIRLDSKRTQIRDPNGRKARGRRVTDLSCGAALYRLSTRVLGTGAYLIRHEGAMRMIAYGQRIFMPIDQAMDRYWENRILPYVVRPFPVLQRDDFGSSTGWRSPDRRLGQSMPVRLRRRMQRAVDGVRKRVFNLVY
jgi:glycosyl transferase family 25